MDSPYCPGHADPRRPDEIDLAWRYVPLDIEEEDRQARIAAGIEMACRICGCSDSAACPGGCIWYAPNLCSRCVKKDL